MFEQISRDNNIFQSESFLKDELSLNTFHSILKDAEKYPSITLFSNHQDCVILNSDPFHGLVIWTGDDFNHWEELFGFIKTTFSNIPQTILSKKNIYDAAVIKNFATTQTPLILGAYKLNKLNNISYQGHAALPEKQDFDEIVELIKLFGKDTGQEEHDIEQKAADFIKNQNAHLFKNEHNEIVALGDFRLTDIYGRIGCVVVKTAYRSKGYGKMLVHSIADRLLKLNKIPMIYTDFNYQPSNRCYQAVGFELQNQIVCFSYNK